MQKGHKNRSRLLPFLGCTKKTKVALQSGWSATSYVTLLILLAPLFRLPPYTGKLHYMVRYIPEAGGDLLHCWRTHYRVHIYRHKAFNRWCCGWRSAQLNIRHCCLNRNLEYVVPQFCPGNVALQHFNNICTVSTLPLPLWTDASPLILKDVSDQDQCNWG